jgi:uncharacterized membrane protein YkvA (DUF1232 family)
MFEDTHPRTVRKWLIVAGVVYFLLPWDLIPDFLGLPGRVDDAGFLALLVWVDRQHAQRWAQRQAAGQGSERPRARREEPAKAFDPHVVLGLAPSASKKEIRTAYRSRMQEYHPDKVAHLGEELQRLAHEKAQEIQRAYETLRG